MKRLEAVTGHTRLYRRGAVYYHRAAIPQDIKDSYPKTEETFSLGTKDYAEALRKVRKAAVEVDERFDEHRRKIALEQASILDDLTPEQIATTKAAYFRQLLELDDDIRLMGFADELARDDQRPDFDKHGVLLDGLLGLARREYARGSRSPEQDEEASALLSELGLRLSPSSPSRRALHRAMQEAAVEAADAMQRRHAGSVVPTPKAPSTPSHAAPLLSEKVKAWVAEKSRADWSEKAKDDHQHWLDLSISVTGDKPVTDYGKADGLRFKAVLMKLPPNAAKSKALRGLAPTDAAEKAKALGMAPMSITNYNKGMQRVGSFFFWAEPNTIGTVVNPINGLRLKDNVHAKDKRDPIAPADLGILFSSPLWRSCRSSRFRHEAGNVVMNDNWRFWLPLLSLWSGARSNELGQLLISDIKHEDGVDFLHVIDDLPGKRVKTAYARRKVPIHDQLKDLGFLALVEDCRKTSRPDSRLFPDLKAGGQGYYSHNATKFFSAYMDKIGIKTEKTAFHSLRHSFQDACRHAKMFAGHREAIAGREEGGVGGNYGDGHDLVDLNDALQTIRYPSVDWLAIPRYRSSTG